MQIGKHSKSVKETLGYRSVVLLGGVADTIKGETEAKGVETPRIHTLGGHQNYCGLGQVPFNSVPSSHGYALKWKLLF